MKGRSHQRSAERESNAQSRERKRSATIHDSRFTIHEQRITRKRNGQTKPNFAQHKGQYADGVDFEQRLLGLGAAGDGAETVFARSERAG